MKTRAAFTVVFVAAVLGAQVLPQPKRAEPRETYTSISAQSIHRRGCLDPNSRERNNDVDLIRVAVEHETTLKVSVQGRDGLLPGFVVTADEGLAAEHGWMREVGSRTGDKLATTVVLPTRGSYTFIIADRRELTGDEMAAGHGCFSADFVPTALPAPQPLPLSWRGTIDTPVAFSVPRRGRDLTLVEATNIAGDGIALVSLFEDKAYVRSFTVSPMRSERVMVSSHAEPARLIIEEASNWGSEPLRVMLRAVPQSMTPDGGDSKDPERIAAAPHDGVM